MSEKLFESLSDGADFERKLVKRGVTMEVFKVAKNNAATLDKIAQAIIGSPAFISDEWVMKLLEAERAAHIAFFGREFDLTLMREVLAKYGLSKVTFWKDIGLEVHFLPMVEFDTSSRFPGWQIMPTSWYWQRLSGGRIRVMEGSRLVKLNHAGLGGIVVLIDTRKRPDYDDGKQRFSRDSFMGDVIEQLRKDGELDRYDYGPQTSRFGISPNEWEEHLKAAWAGEIGLEPNQVRLEMAIEANVIPQLYTNMPRKNEGQSSTSCWCEEFFGSDLDRLVSGNSGNGGHAGLKYAPSNNRYSSIAIRPLGVLA